MVAPVPASTLPVVSSLPHHNAQFLLANPWLHTSLLYSQLYSQRVHPSQTVEQQSVLSVDPDSDQADHSDHATLPCPATPTKSSSASSPASSTKETREKEVDSNKRTEVWRPY